MLPGEPSGALAWPRKFHLQLLWDPAPAGHSSLHCMNWVLSGFHSLNLSEGGKNSTFTPSCKTGMWIFGPVSLPLKNPLSEKSAIWERMISLRNIKNPSVWHKQMVLLPFYPNNFFCKGRVNKNGSRIMYKAYDRNCDLRKQKTAHAEYRKKHLNWTTSSISALAHTAFQSHNQASNSSHWSLISNHSLISQYPTTKGTQVHLPCWHMELLPLDMSVH